MYEYISGRIASLTPTYVVIEAGGIGYYIHISLQTFSEIEKLKEARIFTHFIVREDAQILYGFSTRQEREVFRRLISVSGVGGNTARMVLSTYSPAELSSIISSGNARLLKNVKGLGMKTAEKIIVELKDKMLGIGLDGEEISVMQGGDAVFEEAIAALTQLGFPKAASEKVVRAVMKEHAGVPVEDIIRFSLKQL